MRILVDTNVIIDALTGREPFRKAAEQIFLIAANRTEDLYITASSATDIYYLIRKHLHSTEKAKNAMQKLFELFSILDVTSKDCLDALLTGVKDYEDSVISCCALRNKMDYIVTRNRKDFEFSKISAILPDEFINMLMRNGE